MCDLIALLGYDIDSESLIIFKIELLGLRWDSIVSGETSTKVIS